MPAVAITFYDETRKTVGQATLGGWLGGFKWHQETAQVAVPSQAREAILRVGLHGAVGEISFDNVEVRAN